MKGILTTALLTLCATGGTAATVTEKSGRAAVALPAQENGIFISWRMMPGDTDNTTFDIVRDGLTIATGIADATSYTDADGTPDNIYKVVTHNDGSVTDTSDDITPWTDIYTTARLDRPTGGITATRETYTYYPGDCCVADADGDGRMELLMKWNPTNLHDNSITGQTGPVIIDCYKIPALSGSADVKRMWRINLGTNIRAGEHYTQPMFYDFDGDGCAELICKTAPGSTDAEGNYVSSAATDETIRNITTNTTNLYASGVIKRGEELLTVFDGQTGKALHTVWYNPNRAGGVGGAAAYPADSFWGDGYANRSERYLACVAYLGGRDANPSAVMCRGYYTRAYLWAVDFDGRELKTRWLSASTSPTEMSVTDADGNTTTRIYTTSTSGKSVGYTVYGNGSHNISVGDVDGDGKDEIFYGAATVDDDGWLLYSTGYGHGDAIHLGDFDPDREGMEFFMVHEEGPHYGYHMCDAATGEIIFEANSSDDNGMGTMADIDPTRRGAEFWTAADAKLRDIKGRVIGTINGTKAHKFRIYWDGDAQEEMLYDATVDKWNPEKQTVEHVIQLHRYANSTGTGDYGKPWVCLQADLLGDWREEVVLWNKSDSCTLNIFTTNIPTEIRVPWLMTDHVYEMGVVWQNVAYNMPPHLSYYLPDRAEGRDPSATRTCDYFFTGFTDNTMLQPTWGDAISTGGHTLHMLAAQNEDFDNRFACNLNSEGTTWRFRDASSTLKGLYASTAGNTIAVLNLNDGDEITCMVCNGALDVANPEAVGGTSTIPAGKTTLTVTTAGQSTDLILTNTTARMYVEGFSITSDAATGITTIGSSRTATGKAGIYNMAGQRLSAPRGLCIINGRKVFVK